MNSKKNKSWIAKRIPFINEIIRNFVLYPIPRRKNYWGLFGFLAFLVLIIMIISGVFLSLHYVPDPKQAFASIQKIMREIKSGWFIRYLHAIGASLFFALAYIHLLKAIYHRSYLAPKELVWWSGLILFLIMMTTAFSGYVLVWGQMSFWAATVVSSLFKETPVIGQTITTIIRGQEEIGEKTLLRFYTLHFVMPFILLFITIIHVALSRAARNRSKKIVFNETTPYLPFHPFFTVKIFSVFGFLIVLWLGLVFFYPEFLMNPDNNEPANPLITPDNLTPEWYLLPFFAILKAGEKPALGVVLMLMSIFILFLLPILDRPYLGNKKQRLIRKIFFVILVLDCLVLGYSGSLSPYGINLLICKIATFYYFLHFLVLLPFLSRIKLAITIFALLSISGVKTATAAEWQSARNGADVFIKTCASCHSLDNVRYRDLEKIGIDLAKIKIIAENYTFEDIFDETGEAATRKGTMYDYFAKPYRNEQAARFTNFGALPPDLTNYVKYRNRNRDWVKQYLLSFSSDESIDLPSGFSINLLKEGKITAMAKPFVDGDVAYDDGTTPDEQKMAEDVAAFLAWTADPDLERHNNLGLFAVSFSVFVAFLLLACNHIVWSEAKRRNK